LKPSLLIVLVSVMVGLATAAKAGDLSDAFAIAHKSLVLVKAAGFGSGFVVHSSPESSAILTVAHILGERRSAIIYLNDDPSVGYAASVLKIDKTTDLALLSVRQGRMVPMILSTNVRLGGRIAVVGYPYSSLRSIAEAKEIKPSLQDGVVRLVPPTGYSIEYSATTYQGNSGGPILDVVSGYYVGVVSHWLKNVHGAYEAVGPSAIHDFLKKSGFDIATMEYTGKSR